jgi:GNAT superfamily N-acetyltransferase
MKLIKVNDSSKKLFIKFYEDRYLNKDNKRNSMSSVLKALLYGKSVMCKSVDIEPVMVMDNDRIIMVAILAYAHRMPEFLQISFFEAIEDNPSAFNLILNRAIDLAHKKGAIKISGGLNIHVNYGLGFLASNYDSWQSFGTSHNPPFYNTLFENAGFNTIDMISFKTDMNTLEPLISDRLREKLSKRYTIREVNFKDLENEARIYTKINNESFQDHLFYYPRVAEEDLELFKDFKYILKSENLLFIERDGQAVGFMLWYPDYHRLMTRKESVGLKTVIKSKIYPYKMNTFKIVEIGVVPSEQKRGAIMMLFDYCYSCAKERYENFESGWVLADNRNSYALGEKWADGLYKKYKAFIKDV